MGYSLEAGSSDLAQLPRDARGVLRFGAQPACLTRKDLRLRAIKKVQCLLHDRLGLGLVRLGFGATLSGTGSEAGEGQGVWSPTVRLAETATEHPGKARGSSL